MTRKHFLSIVLIIAAGILPATAVADGGFYVGLNAGQSYFKDAEGRTKSFAEILTINCSACTTALNISNRDLGYQGLVGYRFNDFIALETGYVDFGKVTSTAVAMPPSGFPFIPPNMGTAQTEMRAHGVTLDAMLSYPFTSRLSVFGKFGIIAAHGTSTFTSSGTSGGSGSSGVSGSGTQASYAAGAVFALTNHWSLRGTWQQFHNVPAVGDINFLSLGVTYSFR